MINNEVYKLESGFEKREKYNPKAVELANLLVEAEKKAQKYANIEDKGTMNKDVVLLNLKGKRKDFIEQVEDLANVRIFDDYGQGFRPVIFNNINGQADRRSSMTEEAYEFLYQKGLDVKLFLQID